MGAERERELAFLGHGMAVTPCSCIPMAGAAELGAVELPGIGGVPHVGPSALCLLGCGESQVFEDRRSGTAPLISMSSVSSSHDKYCWLCSIWEAASHPPFRTRYYKLTRESSLLYLRSAEGGCVRPGIQPLAELPGHL